ncbi:uncharacterized protein CCOS01_11956 [Colletotrichum costaricense]|uniref:BTB domain-containing protein n=1 Tax=Colletotrichum costaricense TaxID=1209916 RepID=A0AAI9YNM3_9PEZI|nr:uncharacterized protein CCOS01_11956 [Colletotrichum costaricense]KAK1517699.1 hypothetical protein CCOS01_11956 [Colletotrichum costaricense]
MQSASVTSPKLNIERFSTSPALQTLELSLAMEKVIDYRITSRAMVEDHNKKAVAAGDSKKILDISEDEFVHVYCGDIIFVVFREVITAGSLYFDACLLGFFKESYNQEIFFDDIDSKALKLYLQLTHGWYFEIKSFGSKVVPFSLFDDLVNANDPEAFKRAHLEIPKIKLKTMAQVCILCDRFLHRSLLCIARHMFMTLLARTKQNWNTLKYEDSDWNMKYHVDFMLDYMAAFDLFSTGHDDEHLIRDAISESFYWFTRHTPSLVQHFWNIMSPKFIAEWNVSRHIVWDPESEIIIGREWVRFDHAKKLFITDQLVFENSTKQQKDIRNGRVDNMCSIADRIKLFPFVEEHEDNRTRLARLRAIVEQVQHKNTTQYRTFIPGAKIHPVTGQNDLGQRATSKKQGKNKANHAGSGLGGGGRDRDNMVKIQRNHKAGNRQPKRVQAQRGDDVADATSENTHSHAGGVGRAQGGGRGQTNGRGRGGGRGSGRGNGGAQGHAQNHIQDRDQVYLEGQGQGRGRGRGKNRGHVHAHDHAQDTAQNPAQRHAQGRGGGRTKTHGRKERRAHKTQDNS